MGHLTFVPKRLSAVGNKRISQFFDSASERRSWVIALVDSTWVFSVVVVLYSYIVEYAFVQSVERSQVKQEIRSG